MKTTIFYALAILLAIGSAKGNDGESIEQLKLRVVALEKEIEILKAKQEKMDPEIKVSSADSNQEAIILVSVRKDGEIILEGDRTKSDDLTKHLKKMADTYPDQAVVIRGEESVPYKDILVVLNSCRKAGIWNLAFSSTQTKTEQ